MLRLLFAGTVCLVHASQLSGYPQLAWIENIFSSAVAVKAFFVVSGFLIFMSYERSSSVASYAGKRFRRIYPAYLTVVILCAIGLLAVSTKNVSAYFSQDWGRYVLANLSFLNFLHPTLPGVFESNRLQAVNGALWTLKIEVLFYLSVPLFVVFFKRWGRFRVITIAYVFSCTYTLLFSWLAAHSSSGGGGRILELGRQFPGQLAYFMAGGFFYYYLPLFERHFRYFVCAAVLILLANVYWPTLFFEPFALATIVVFFAIFLYVGNFGKYGDFSYGVYILHFPIIQCFIHFGWLEDRPWLFLLAVVLLTLATAVIMWHVVEKRFLQRNNHYLAANSAAL
ncbi:MAG: acyltransferase [Azonexus sp.]|nr:acyltransferase [Azonexus sp.]